MEKAIPQLSKFVVFIAILSLLACGDDFAFTTKRYMVKPESKLWMANDSVAGKPFLMIDNNRITHNFQCSSPHSDINEGSTYFLFIPTENTFVETISPSYWSSYGENMSVYLYADFAYGEDIHFNLKDLSVIYRIDENEIQRVSFKTKYIYPDTIIKRNLVLNESFKSTFEQIETYDLRGRTYRNVLHFTLKDFQRECAPFDLTEFYYAKNVGFVKLVYFNGITLERK